MRRALLTAKTTPALPPFTVGSPAIDRPAISSGSGNVFIDLNGAAERAGTLTSVQVYGYAAGSVTLFTGSLSGGMFTISGVSPLLSMTVGLNTFSVSLPIPSGGYLGLRLNDAVGSIVTDTSSGSRGFAGGAPAPTVGGTYAIQVFTGRHSLQGTGS